MSTAEQLAEHLAAPADAEGFLITCDSEAQWALRKMHQAEKEIARIERAASDERQRVDEWQTRTARTHADTVTRMADMLIDYRRRLEADDPKLPATYRLPGGVIKRTKGSESIEVDDADAFLVNAPEHYVRVKREVDKSALLNDATLQVTEAGQMYDPVIGEVFPGVRKVRADDRYSVKLEGDL